MVGLDSLAPLGSAATKGRRGEEDPQARAPPRRYSVPASPGLERPRTNRNEDELRRIQKPSHPRAEARGALRNRKATLVELERAGVADSCLPSAPQLPLSALIPLSPRLLPERGRKGVARCSLVRPAVHRSVVH